MKTTSESKVEPGVYAPDSGKALNPNDVGSVGILAPPLKHNPCQDATDSFLQGDSDGLSAWEEWAATHPECALGQPD